MIAESDGVTFRGNQVHDNYGLGLWCDIDCHNAVYEDNLVENNQYSGICHEISFKAVIRNNVLRNNGKGDRGWFWGADITIAASQDVEVTGNTVTVAPGGCGIMLIDQGRRDDGKIYKTRNNTVRANEMTFEGAACAGGVSDTKPDSGILRSSRMATTGSMATHTVSGARADRPASWGSDVTDWDGFGVAWNGAAASSCSDNSLRPDLVCNLRCGSPSVRQPALPAGRSCPSQGYRASA